VGASHDSTFDTSHGCNMAPELQGGVPCKAGSSRSGDCCLRGRGFFFRGRARLVSAVGVDICGALFLIIAPTLASDAVRPLLGNPGVVFCWFASDNNASAVSWTGDTASTVGDLAQSMRAACRDTMLRGDRVTSTVGVPGWERINPGGMALRGDSLGSLVGELGNCEAGRGDCADVAFRGDP
jgi:hypothetical protein